MPGSVSPSSTPVISPAASGKPLRPEQVRFGDGDVDRWAERMSSLTADENTKIGAAIHSVRAVPDDAMTTVAAAAAGRPLHVHLSEQPQENGECLAIYGVTPSELLSSHGVLGAGTTAVHATHVEPADIALLASSSTGVCLCPTTERDLGDGIDAGFAFDQAGSADLARDRPARRPSTPSKRCEASR